MNAAVLRARRPWRVPVLLAGLLAAVWLAAWWVEFDIRALLGRDGVEAFRKIGERLWPPKLSSEVVHNALTGMLQTLALSIVGTLFGVLLGLCLAPFAARTLFMDGPLTDRRRGPAAWLAHKALHIAARLCANALRTIPYLILAMLFVFMVGLGPFAGALALALHTGGVFGRLYAQAIDELDPRPLLALQATGASRFQIWFYGMLPALRPALLSYTFYRWEVNIREAAVLGFVGAGGLGYYIQLALGTFHWSALGTYLLATLLLVLAVDALSARLRKALL